MLSNSRTSRTLRIVAKETVTTTCKIYIPLVFSLFQNAFFLSLEPVDFLRKRISVNTNALAIYQCRLKQHKTQRKPFLSAVNKNSKSNKISTDALAVADNRSSLANTCLEIALPFIFREKKKFLLKAYTFRKTYMQRILAEK